MPSGPAPQGSQTGAQGAGAHGSASSRTGRRTGCRNNQRGARPPGRRRGSRPRFAGMNASTSSTYLLEGCPPWSLWCMRCPRPRQRNSGLCPRPHSAVLSPLPRPEAAPPDAALASARPSIRDLGPECTPLRDPPRAPVGAPFRHRPLTGRALGRSRAASSRECLVTGDSGGPPPSPREGARGGRLDPARPGRSRRGTMARHVQTHRGRRMDLARRPARRGEAHRGGRARLRRRPARDGRDQPDASRPRAGIRPPRRGSPVLGTPLLRRARPPRRTPHRPGAGPLMGGPSAPPHAARPARRATAALLLAALPSLLLPGDRLPPVHQEAADDEAYGILEPARSGCPASPAPSAWRPPTASPTRPATRRAYRLTLDDALALGRWPRATTARSARTSTWPRSPSPARRTSSTHPLRRLGTGDVLAGRAARGGAEARVRGAAGRHGPKAFETGGSLVVALATDFLRNIIGLRPLLAGPLAPQRRGGRPPRPGFGLGGPRALTQAERDTLYAIRTFARFQQEFTVESTASVLPAAAAPGHLAERGAEPREPEPPPRAPAGHGRPGRRAPPRLRGGPDPPGRAPRRRAPRARPDGLRVRGRLPQARPRHPGGPSWSRSPRTTSRALRAAGPATLPGRRRSPSCGARPPPGPAERGDQEVDAWRRMLVAKNALGAQVDLRRGGAPEAATAALRP